MPQLVGRPERVARLRKDQVQRLLGRNRIRRHDADAVLAALRPPPLHVAPGTVEAAGFHVRALVDQLRLLTRQLAACDARTRELLAALSTPRPSESDSGQPTPSREPCDVAILRSLPGVGEYVVATVLAEASQALGTRDYGTLRALAGVAPVTRRSGKGLVVLRRQASNPRLVDAAYFWGQGAIKGDAAARHHYQQLRARGHKHARALRGVVDRLLDVAIAMLRDRTLCDASRRHQHPVTKSDPGGAGSSRRRGSSVSLGQAFCQQAEGVEEPNLYVGTIPGHPVNSAPRPADYMLYVAQRVPSVGEP